MNSVSSIVAILTTGLTFVRTTRSSSKVALTVPVNITWIIETGFWVNLWLVLPVIPVILILVLITHNCDKMQTSAAEGTPGEDTEDDSRG